MKLIFQPLWLGAIALSLAATPLRAIARVPHTLQPSTHKQQRLDTQTLFVRAQQLPIFAGVNITNQQATLMRPIFEQTRTRIERVLTPEQQNQFHQALLTEGRSFDEAVERMNLSSEQKQRLDGILQMTGLQVAPILTEAQRDRIEANLATQ